MKIERNMWKVQISDGYCIWEYEYPEARNDVSIKDVANAIAGFLVAPPNPPKFKKGLND